VRVESMQGVVGIGAYVTIQGLTSDVGARLNGLSGKVVAKGDNGRYVRARQLCINQIVHACLDMGMRPSAKGIN
jgi:hypothetical protein